MVTIFLYQPVPFSIQGNDYTALTT